MYPDIRARGGELVEVGPNVPANAVDGLRQYLGGRELEFPYLCDQGWGVHRLYGLRHVDAAEFLRAKAEAERIKASESLSLRPPMVELRQMLEHPMEQGLFVIDREGVIRLAHVSSPVGPLPSTDDLLAVLDGLSHENPPLPLGPLGEGRGEC